LLVNPGYQFGNRGTGHLRLCFAQDESAWEAASERLLETLRDLADESSAQRGARKLVRGRR
jgi:aspartate/methionine/tyrosine aminotransferase